MSDIPDSVLEQMRTQLRELELDHVQLAGRIMQLRDSISLLEHAGRRRGRPRKADIIEIPQGTLYDPDAEPPIEEAQSTLKETVA
jgi:hypothetical protein